LHLSDPAAHEESDLERDIVTDTTTLSNFLHLSSVHLPLDDFSFLMRGEEQAEGERLRPSENWRLTRRVKVWILMT
jgi:hypothetical protein